MMPLEIERGTRTQSASSRRCSLPPWLWLALAAASPGAPASAVERIDSFATDPIAQGWRISGDSSLFHWNAAEGAIDVTWDSSRSNSFCFRPLGTVLTRADNFRLTFALRLTELRLGSTPGKPAEFPIAVGLIHQSMTTNANTYRGAGVSGTYGVRNLIEWDFYADAGFGDTWATTVVSTNNVFAYGHTFPVPLIPGDLYRITLAYTASNQVLRTTALRNGQPMGEFETIVLSGRPDFRVDAVSITSYSDAVQPGPAMFHGSVHARGQIEDIALSLPPPPVDQLALHLGTNERGASFLAASNWMHRLERSVDLQAWLPASAWMSGQGSRATLRDTNAVTTGVAFYRIRSERP